MSPSQPETRGPIKTKPQLVHALREAAEIEQQLMVIYLYAAFSMKKRPDERRSSSSSAAGGRPSSWWRGRSWSTSPSSTAS